jgi:hypothetical protein
MGKYNYFGYVEGQGDGYNIKKALDAGDTLETLLGCCRVSGITYHVDSNNCKIVGISGKRWNCTLRKTLLNGDVVTASYCNASSAYYAVSMAISYIIKEIDKKTVSL